MQRPELTWKIRAIWGRITHGAEYNIRVVVDIYSDLFYVLLPVDGNVNPSLLLVGDYSLGLDYQNIRWSMYTFPWVVNDIMMGYYGGDTGGGADYYLRMGTNGAIYKLDNSASEDEGTTYINNYYQTSPLAIGDPGPINVFRFIRYRLAGSGTLVTTVTDQGRNTYENAPNVIPMAYPGNYKDFGIQINFVNEKMLVRFGTQAGADNFRMSRVDVFGKNRWPTRPNG